MCAKYTRHCSDSTCWLSLQFTIMMFSALWGPMECPGFTGPKSHTITVSIPLFCFVLASYILEVWLILLWLPLTRGPLEVTSSTRLPSEQLPPMPTIVGWLEGTVYRNVDKKKCVIFPYLVSLCLDCFIFFHPHTHTPASTQRSRRILLSDDCGNIFGLCVTISFIEWCLNSRLVSAFTRCLPMSGLWTICSFRILAASWAFLPVLFLFCLLWNLRARMTNLRPGFLSLRKLFFWLKELGIISGFDLGYSYGLLPGSDG